MRKTALTLLTATATTAALALAPAAFAAHGGLIVTGLTVNERLVTFKANDPATILSEIRITGLQDGDDVAGIDFRPATGQLYALVTSTDSGARLFVVDPATGAAQRVGTTTYPIAGSISIDFNPAVDRLRVVSDDGTNLRVHPDTGALAATDGDLAYVSGDVNQGSAPAVGAVAYTNNQTAFVSKATVLYDIDAALDQLAEQNPPNEGGLKSIGGLPQDTKAQATGFDIYQREIGGMQTWAFVSLVDKGRSTFYEIDLTTGAAKTFAASPGDPASGTVIGGRPFVTDIALEPAQGV